ncbi:MAG: hypothetical protein IIZ17_08745 [Eubacteriaceae bacterium]|nr:hypothetical protein [Eubacteriaceae bacterium]
MGKSDDQNAGFGEEPGFLQFTASQNIGCNFRNLYYLIFLTNVLGIDVLVAGTMMYLAAILLIA